MAAIESLRTALSALARDPVLFLGGLLYGAVVLPQNALSLAGVQYVPTLIQILTFFVTPFVVAGIIGMAAEAVDGETSFGTLTRVGRGRYVSLLLGNLVEFGIVFLFGVVFLIAIVAAALTVGVGLEAGGLGVGALAAALLVFGLLLLAFVAVMFFIQFFPVAIVVDEAGAVEGFKESASLVRSNLFSTLGYSIISFLVTVVTSLPLTGYFLYQRFGGGLPTSPPATPGTGPGSTPTPGMGAGMESFFSTSQSALSTSQIVVVSAALLVLTAVLLTFQQTYATAFYRRHSESIEDRVLNDAP